MKIKRITPPKYRVGKYSLNEYELRNLMLEVAQKQKPAGIKVKDERGAVVTILENGRLSESIAGFDINSMLTLKLLKISRES
jgi:hypothetical protein